MGQGLSKNDMDFLKKSTIYDEDTINQLYHDFKSGCPNGKMKPKTFIRIYSKCFPDGNAQKFSDRAFRTFDMDNNGHLDFKEFLLALDFVSSEEPEEKLKWAFSMYDVDENGHISLEEMTKFVLEIYHMMGDSFESREDLEDEAKNIFRIMDVDMDGKVSQEEFVKVLQNNKELVDLLTLTDV